jgi:sporulation protein YtfJ
MNTAMSNLKDMIDVNTVIGEAIETVNGTVIIPISKVCFGFAAGGSEFVSSALEETKKKGSEEETKSKLPFGGGSGAGVNIVPVGFLVVNESGTKMLPVDHCSAIDKLLDYVPEAIDKITEIFNGEKTYTYEFYEDADGNCEESCTCGCHENQNEEESEEEE